MTAVLTAADIRPYRAAARDHAQTEELKAALAGLRASRNPFWLGTEDIEPILRWKLERQYGRQAALRAAVTDDMWRTVTGATFAIEDSGSDLESRIRVGLLCSLPGVEVPVASAILAIVDPSEYCVIDFRGWRAMFGVRRDQFSVPQYLAYRAVVRGLADELRWSVQETDLAVWALDAERDS